MSLVWVCFAGLEMAVNLPDRSVLLPSGLAMDHTAAVGTLTLYYLFCSSTSSPVPNGCWPCASAGACLANSPALSSGSGRLLHSLSVFSTLPRPAATYS